MEKKYAVIIVALGYGHGSNNKYDILHLSDSLTDPRVKQAFRKANECVIEGRFDEGKKFVYGDMIGRNFKVVSR